MRRDRQVFRYIVPGTAMEKGSFSAVGNERGV